MVLVGVQPVLMQVPPRCSLSTRATLQPWSASFCDSGLPAWPEPRMMASYCGMGAPRSGWREGPKRPSLYAGPVALPPQLRQQVRPALPLARRIDQGAEAGTPLLQRAVVARV